jgi:tetratricopeptide (TPR) repeat protein
MQGLFLLLILPLLMPQVQAAVTGEAEASFQLGRQSYEKEAYAAAIEAFSTAVRLAPNTSTYHHWLGKSYGRLAQNSNFLKAYRLAAKTRTELERAVTLDDKNIEAIEDLMEFYRQAPVFLGGGQDKADRLRRRLEELHRQNTSPSDQT